MQNILLLGSQTRKGQGKGFGTNPSLDTSNSDNLLLVHLDARHTHAIILSIPRDTIVYEPGCRARPGVGTGIWGPYQSAIIDGAMNIGGPSCAVSTVKDLTGVEARSLRHVRLQLLPRDGGRDRRGARSACHPAAITTRSRA